MAIVRTYMCDECGTKFDKLHFESSEPAPPCPGCEALSARQTPAGFSIGTTKGQALDITQRIVEEDYGMSNMRDNMREGDVAAIATPQINQAAATFFQQSPQRAAPSAMMQSAIASAKSGAALARAENRSPLTMIQRAAKAQGRQNARDMCIPLNRVK